MKFYKLFLLLCIFLLLFHFHHFAQDEEVPKEAWYNILNINKEDVLLDIYSEEELLELHNNNKHSIIINDEFIPNNSIETGLKENYEILEQWYKFMFKYIHKESKPPLKSCLVFQPIELNMNLNYIKIILPEPLVKDKKYRIEIMLEQNKSFSLTQLKVLEFVFSENEINELKDDTIYNYKQLLFDNIYADGKIDLNPLGFHHGLTMFSNSYYNAQGSEKYLYIGIFKQNEKFNKKLLKTFDNLEGYGCFDLNCNASGMKLFIKKYSIITNLCTIYEEPIMVLPYIFIKRIIILEENTY